MDAEWRNNFALAHKKESKILDDADKTDEPGSFAAALGASERVRMALNSKQWPGCSSDLGQDASRPFRSLEADDLHTLTKSMGLICVPSLNRWYTPTELFLSMGFPVDSKSQDIVGVASTLGYGSPSAPASRTRHSLVAALGNAMHVNSMGAALMVMWLRYPRVLAEVPSSSSAGLPAGSFAFAETAETTDKAAKKTVKRLRCPSGQTAGTGGCDNKGGEVEFISALARVRQLKRRASTD